LWCPACARAAEHDDDIDPEHYELLDKTQEKLIPWDCVEVVS
jgi:glutaredoxin